jgi:hypothetical protein
MKFNRIEINSVIYLHITIALAFRQMQRGQTIMQLPSKFMLI